MERNKELFVFWKVKQHDNINMFQIARCVRLRKRSVYLPFILP